MAVKRLLGGTALLAGCVFGGGPLVGVGPRGTFIGAEASAGGELILPQATLGYQSDLNLVYVRADETYDVAADQMPTSGPDGSTGTFWPGARIGGGIGLAVTDDDHPLHGIFVLGPSLGHVLGHLAVGPFGDGCGVWNTVVVVEAQIRYAGGWSFVLEPRVERGETFCN